MFKNQKNLFNVLFLLLLPVYILLNLKEMIKIKFGNPTLVFQNNSGPLILFYTNNYELKSLPDEFVLNDCSVQCHISNNPMLYPYSAVAIFHSRDMKMDDFLLKHRNQNRLNVYHTVEAFPHEKIRHKHFPKDFFNITRTHRRDSTLWLPHTTFEKIQLQEKNNELLVWSEKEVARILLKKSKLATVFSSHCITHSLREILINDMKRFSNISTFGACYNATEFDANVEIEKHFFYLAFENAVCKDYVTEKFWRIKELIVPVVMKRSLLKGIVEDKYFIAADDFNSTKGLVERLVYLSKNITEYKKYFGWTKKYKKNTKIEKTEWLCKLCKMAAKKENHLIPDIYKWAETQSECQFNYMNFTLQYIKSNNLSMAGYEK